MVARPVRDRYGRPVLSLRVSLTQRCNLKCPYCHREGEVESRAEMTPEEISRIVRIAADFGARAVKLTGGEPLLRNDIVDVVRLIASTPGIKEVSMTTNATRLAGIAQELKNAGLRRVNVNLLSLRPDVYCAFTGGRLSDAIEGIDAAVRAGLTPVKVNMLILRGVNEGEVNSMLKFCVEKKLTLQLIELEPVNLPEGFYERYHAPLDAFKERFAREAVSIERRRWMHNRVVFHLPQADVELVPPVENTEFCLHCTRMRLTSDGRLKPCLMRNDNLVDILMPMRSGASEAELRRLFLRAVELREPYYQAISHSKSFLSSG